MKTLLILLVGFFLTTPENENRTSGYDVGDYATDFKLKNVNGNMVSLADYEEARGFIVAFTCNTCPYAVMYEDRINELHNKYAPKGYPVVAINPNCPYRQPGDSFDEMKKRAKEKNFNFAYLVDETQDIAKTYGATNTPHIYILNKDKSKYKVAYIGAIDNNPKDGSKATHNYVEEAIDQLLNGEEVKETRTKSIGCTIKWKQV